MADEPIKRGPGRPRKNPEAAAALDALIAEEPVKMAEPVTAVASAVATVVKPVPSVKVRAVYRPMWHPYQQVRIPYTHFITLPIDNWLEVQINANVLTTEP
jgi:hypothetical protein